ncbi:TolC family protein [Hyphomicrobium sp.]|uniref:TolC family protein n=1 Tax=Hyphomicrobium sp. TaxID=82 RepID=UPI003D14E860
MIWPLSLLIVAAAATSRCVAADENGPLDAGPLSLSAVLQQARRQNPDIKAAEARLQAMQQRPVQEGTLPDPSLSVRYHNESFDQITFGESDFSFVELQGEQEIPFPGKLRLRTRMATRDAERERAMRDMTVLMVLAEAASRYAELAAVDRSDAILRESRQALEVIVQEASTSYGVGTAAQTDVLRAKLERAGLDERFTMLAQQRAAGSAALNALLDRSAGEVLGRAVWRPELGALEPLPMLQEQLAAASPQLRAATEELVRSEDAVELARRDYLPDFAVMAAYTNKDDLLPEWEVGVRMSVPLYFWRRQGPALAEARYARAAAEHGRRNVHLTLVQRLAELHSMAKAARRLVALYHETLIPQASITLESARASYAVGRVDFLDVLSAFTALLEYRLRETEEVARYQQTHAAIGPLIGALPNGATEEVGP